MPKGTLLIVEDEPSLRGLLAQIFELEGYLVVKAEDARSGWKALEREEIGVVLTDVKLPDENGLDLLARIKAKYQWTEVVVMTAYGTISGGVQAIKGGAFDYITKGDGDEQIVPVVERAFEKYSLQKRIHHLETSLGNKFSFSNIIGKSPLILQAISLAEKVAPTDTTVLLLGETGTGKEVFAQSIHQASPRRLKSFVALNCSAIAKDILESELFGHKAGAFTGANRDKKGLVEEANHGTLFLDEIGELPIELQAKLLRFIETGCFYKVGDSKETKVNVRLLAATNRDLQKEIETEHFRADLYYRLSVFTIHLPALRNRREDISALAENFMVFFAAKVNRPKLSASPEFLKALKDYNYKGNIRELKNIIERAVILANDNVLTPDLLPLQRQEDKTDTKSKLLSEIERQHIIKVLEENSGNKAKAAEELGIGLATLYRKLHDYGIE